VVEVSDSTLRGDLARKVPRYARNAIIEVWVADLTADVVHVHRDPDRSSRYTTEFDVKLDDDIGMAAFPEILVPVVKLFPASRSGKPGVAPSGRR
jgi:Uma2 family endonuclease